ncbi:protoporphyrinogen oxidase [Paenibacillus enshidis]|uniref:Coproporphyrinogen III oxidase n=1 Tax=Paenibacillus enshidis TaxID=1458439 RepID=A0ABV5ANK4_9BACL
MQRAVKRIVVLGGGITGLSAAFYLQKLAGEKGVPLEITLVEQNDRLGGKLHTVYRDGFMIEKGPDAFLARKTSVLELTAELGMEADLVSTRASAKTACILHNGKLHPMPMGFILGIPTRMSSFIRTGLISPLGKARAALDLILPARKGSEDESLGDFIERRLGKEVLEQITEPLLSGIYAGDTRYLSLLSTFPQFRQMEQRHRSLIKGMALGGGQKSSSLQGLPEIAKKSMFLSYKNGMSAVIDRLEKRLDSVRFIMGQTVVKVCKEDEYRIHLENGETLGADGVVCAVPAFAAAKIFAGAADVGWLDKINYVSVANIGLAYRNEDVNHAFAASGFLVPRKEGKRITACTWSSAKWAHVAPEGLTLLRTYIGRAGAEDWVRWSDEELAGAARKDLKDLQGIAAEPELVEISRCNRAMPQYPVGHMEQMRLLREQLARHLPEVQLCGAGYGGVGVPDCIRQGKEAAERLLAAVERIRKKDGL